MLSGISYREEGAIEMPGQRESKGSSKWELDTPCLVVDEEMLAQNIRAMQAHAVSFGKQLVT